MPSLERPKEPNRPWYKRLTVIGASIFSVLEVLEQTDTVPKGTRDGAAAVVAASANVAQVFGGFLATIGVYRHLAGD